MTPPGKRARIRPGWHPPGTPPPVPGPKPKPIKVAKVPPPPPPKPVFPPTPVPEPTIPGVNTPRYGLSFPSTYSAIGIEIYCIQQGGSWTLDSGKLVGAGLFNHYRNLQSLLWPADDHHEWSDMMLRSMVEERFTTVLGSKDCSKTRSLAKFALTDYFCFPETTLCLVSSTTLQGMQLRVWGDLKTLFVRAKEVWPEAPGYPLESKCGIFTDDMGENVGIRDMRKGILCVAMRNAQGQWVGLAAYTGIKQKRRRLMADEVQYYLDSYISTLANLDKGDFKGLFVGNPIGDNDPLDKLSEPENGWDSLPDILTTTTWKNKWGGNTINLVGSDSPAIKHPGQYPYLINQQDIDRIIKRFGKDSYEYWNQAMGVRKPGLQSHRVFTRDMAKQFGSCESAVWRDPDRTRGYALDASYGGDRCVGIPFEFGPELSGLSVLSFGDPEIIPIRVYPKSTLAENRLIPEDQIANHVMRVCDGAGIPPENVFFDATGRGSLGTSFARLWSALVNPIEFGGDPTNRPVCNDLYLYDPDTRHRRLKLASEHYSKFVTELWFSLRYAGESQQLRDLPEVVLDELAKREWKPVRGDRYEIETKAMFKERYGYSPDNADAAVIAVEGARRLGFAFARLEQTPVTSSDRANWHSTFQQLQDKLRKSYTLNYAA